MRTHKRRGPKKFLPVKNIGVNLKSQAILKIWIQIIQKVENLAYLKSALLSNLAF